MIRFFALLVLLSAKAEAAVLVETTLEKALSASLKVGGTFPAKMLSYSVGAVYFGDLPRSLIGIGKERFTLGLSMQAGSIYYRTVGTTNEGAHFGISFRPGWSCWLGDKWIIQASLPIFLFTRMSAGAFSEATIDGSRIQSASLSDLRGSGGIGLSMRGLRRLGIKLGKSEAVAGVALEFRQQSLQKKVDEVLSSAPNASEVNSIARVKSGSYRLSSLVLLIEGGVLH